MARRDVIIIGAGIAGLSAAIELAASGYEVLVVERGKSVGGKMREVVVGGRPIDAGPTVFTMRWVFDELLEKAGTRLEEHIGLKKAEILARHTWDSDPRLPLDLYANINRSADAIGEFAGQREAEGYRAFCEEARTIFQTLKEPYIASQKPGLFDLPLRVGLGNIKELWQTKPFTSMWSALGKHFSDQRLHQLFGRYATYCGSSPYEAAATLMLVAHVEQDGVWLVEGGMHRLARGLANVAENLGVQFKFGQGVSKIIQENGSISRIKLSNGEDIQAPVVISNADVAAISLGLFGPSVQPAVPPMERKDRSLSAITWQINGETSGFPLSRHTVFFSQDYAAEFRQLFGESQLPFEPTTYICAQDRDDLGRRRAKGRERLLVLVNAPATGDIEDFDDPALAKIEQKTFAHLARCGLNVERGPEYMKVTTPADFNTLFPATGGALYGRASHGWRASFQRPGAVTSIPGLYLASGSAHPGPGVPMAALSGRLAASKVIAHRPKQYPARRVYETLEAAQ